MLKTTIGRQSLSHWCLGCNGAGHSELKCQRHFSARTTVDQFRNAAQFPIKLWGDYSPNAQTNNAVYAAIITAVSNGIHVVQAGGNGSVNTGNLSWYGDSGAIIVGAGGATTSNDR